jgi:hypothetical protein
MSSVSSYLISKVTAFRNPNGDEYEWTRISPQDRARPSFLKAALAEAAYVAIIPFSIVEAAVSLIAKLFSQRLPLSEESHKGMSRWVKSSIFSIGWTSFDAVINPIANDLIVTEKVVTACAYSGNFTQIPPHALRA